jgi:uncharacterized protein (DUF433 family)
MQKGRLIPPILREVKTGSSFVTWGEMVETRLLANFRSQNVSVQKLRPAVMRLRAEFGAYPLAQAEPFLEVSGRELVQRIQSDLGLGDINEQFIIVRDQQLLLAPCVQKFSDSADYRDGFVAQFKPSNVTPEVVVNPLKGFGLPVVRNTRTEALAEAFRAGATSDEIARWFDLSDCEVTSAIRFELITAA